LASAFLAFLEASAVTTGDCRGPPLSDLRIRRTYRWLPV